MTRTPDRVLQQAVRSHLVDLVEQESQRAAMRPAGAQGRGLERLRIATVSLVVGATVAAAAAVLVLVEPRPTFPGPAKPSPMETPTFVAPTCESLLDPVTRRFLERGGYVFTGEEYQQRVETDPTSDIGEVVRLGGIACQWGLPNTDASLSFAYGPITAARAAAVEARIAAEGAIQDQTSPYDRYDADDGATRSYAFGDGYWAYAVNTIDRDVLDEIVANAPAF